jgi:ABC-type polysaccharide/polyol phosphate transport system ATPase subunit
MSSEDIAISVRNLTKTYRIFGHPGDRIKQAMTFGLRKYHKEFTALKDVSFDIKKGETVCIIGRNGSGKSTLLQLICGILKPTSGSVRVNGRVSALLELGAGFNPEFTGRENVYFQGALMGLDKETMDARFDDIAAFADIGEFIEQPVRMYSSGMFVRLAFSVAIHVDPEILAVDEALAVGDSAFQAKCLRRINSIRNSGGAILIVTHSAEQVAHFCDRAILLDNGNIITYSGAAETLRLYYNRLKISSQEKVTIRTKGRDQTDAGFQRHPLYNPQEIRLGDNSASIVGFELLQNGLVNPPEFLSGLLTELRLHIRFHVDIQNPIYGLQIKNAGGVIVFSTNTLNVLLNPNVDSQMAGDEPSICFTFNPFLDAGNYLISVGISSETPSGIVPNDRRYDSIVFCIAHPVSSTGENGIDLNPSFSVLDN